MIDSKNPLTVGLKSAPIRVAFIHNEQKIGTGAHHINDLIAAKLKEHGVEVKNFYPSTHLLDVPVYFRGLANMLFFHSLLLHKEEILSCDLIQGTTYTPLAFLSFPIPVISHFGSTTAGFLANTPLTNKIEVELRPIYYDLKKKGVIDSVNVRTRKPMRDIAEVEKFVAERSHAVVATSRSVAAELVSQGIQKEKVHLVHNAIEDYWFENSNTKLVHELPRLVFVGRLGGNAFELKLKGFDRLVVIAEFFPQLEKIWFCMTTNKKLSKWILEKMAGIRLFINLKKDQIPIKLENAFGDIVIITSRYEGFSLSLIEAMTRGAIPVTYPCGVAPEIIVNGVNGYIVHSTQEARERIGEIIQSKELRTTLATESMKTARLFAATKIAQNLVSIYQKVLADGISKK